MHEYTLDNGERWRIATWCLVPAVALTLISNTCLDRLGVSFPWFVDAPSPLLFYGAVLAAFDRWCWLWKVGGWRVSSVPDLRGTWLGTLRSSHDKTTTHTAALRVRQRWSRISVSLETEHSRSISTTAAVACEAGDGLRLQYIYRNDPHVFATDTMRPHEGTASLRLSPDGKRLDGEYYTGHQRVTAGEMRFAFCDSHLLSLQEAIRASSESFVTSVQEMLQP